MSSRAGLRRKAVAALALSLTVWAGTAVSGPSTPSAGSRPGDGVAAPAAPGPPLQSLLDRARGQRWDTLAVGERVARFGRALEGTPYVDGTLEGPGPEVCRVTTTGLDCVTFMELCLNLARVTGPGVRDDSARSATPADVVAAVTFTRYRGGRLTDYTSRLHYTSEWIADNVAKGVFVDFTPALGGTPCEGRFGYMSAHPERYPALRANPAFTESMRRIERAIRRIPRACIPRERVAAIEPRLRTGDLVAIATSLEGLDYAHTGMIVRDPDGAARLLHASSKHGRVILDVRLGDYLATAPKSFTGVTILRPLEAAGGR